MSSTYLWTLSGIRHRHLVKTWCLGELDERSHMYSKSGYEEMDDISQGAQMVSNLIGKVLRTGRSPGGTKLSDKEQLDFITDVVTHVEENKGQDEAIKTFIESVGKGLQKPGEFVNDNAGGGIDDSGVNRTGGGKVVPGL
ncbi:hypothetical protein [Streptomyces syringium]|uniref:hypothetical protein n=1 Tax=Streptomyces syringium TaxID=76729 RepID=UPI0037D451EA